MDVIAVDAEDPRVADYVRLREVSLRKHLEARHGLFIAEGETVIRRAVAAGYSVRSFLTSRRWLEPLADLVEATGAPCYVLEPDRIEQLTGFDVHRGALASMHRKPLPGVAEVLRTARTVVVLEDIVDHTNVGTIFRSVAALGIDAVLLAPRCADPLYRRSVKVSMGNVFAVPYARMERWRDGLAELRAAGFDVLALTPAADADRLDHRLAARNGPVALALGTEGDGLSAHWLESADARVRIPIRPDVDSLNVAAAAAIACYLLATRRFP